MNIRSLTRGDGAVIGAAVLLLIASFFSYYELEDCGQVFGIKPDCDVSAWSAARLPLVTSVHLAGLAAAGLIVAPRLLPRTPKPAGLSLEQWGMALSVFVFWTALWSLFAGGKGVSVQAGGYLSFLFSLALAGAAIARPLVPALAAPLLPSPAPRTPGSPYGQGAQGGYGYPGPSGQPTGGYGYPGGAGSSYGPAPDQGTQPSGPAPDFAPFWFAVPVPRPLFPEDGGPTPIAELSPGVWHLAVDQRGGALVAQTQDGRRGILPDTSGIQRG